jgi:hypothetical protein
MKERFSKGEQYMTIVLFEIEVSENIELYEVRAYRNRGPEFETINFRNGMGSRALMPGLYDIVALMWGAKGSGIKLKVTAADDVYKFSGEISDGRSDVFTNQIIVGPLQAFGILPTGDGA